MLVTGKCREVFDINAFVKRQGKCYAILQHVRRKVAVRVTDDRCPVLLAMQKLKRSGKDGQQETKNQKEEETNSRVQLSSQTYLDNNTKLETVVSERCCI